MKQIIDIGRKVLYYNTMRDGFTDLHCHIIYGVDDGAKDKEEMFSLLEASYDDGVRTLCVTPHYHPGYYGHNGEKFDIAYSELAEYVRTNHPDMDLHRANELHWNSNSMEWIQKGMCRTVDGSRYVLVDFSDSEKEKTIIEVMNSMLNSGYRPILAHPERYVSLSYKTMGRFKERCVDLQLDCGSFFGEYGFLIKRRAHKILNFGLCDFVSSDAHHLDSRKTMMTKTFEFIKNKYDEDIAWMLCSENAKKYLMVGDKNGQN